MSPSCLHGDHDGHASEPVPKDGLVLCCGILLRRYVLILRKALKDRSASALPTGSVQPMHRSCLTFGNWSSSACWRHPKRLTGWLCADRFSQWATHSFSCASIAVGVGRSSSQLSSAICCRLDFSFRRLTGTRLNLNVSKLVVVWDYYGTNERCLAYFYVA